MVGCSLTPSIFMRPGIVEFTWGHPDLALSRRKSWPAPRSRVRRDDGPVVLRRGAGAGQPDRAAFCAWLGQRQDRAIPPERIFIAGGLSQGFDLLCTLSPDRATRSWSIRRRTTWRCASSAIMGWS